MRYIEQFREGMRVSDVYLCKTKQHAVTKNGKEYASVLLQDKTGTVDCKIWDLSSPGINDFEPLQYVYVDGDVTVFQGSNQLNIKRIRKADEGEYQESDYLPVSSKDIKIMYQDLTALVQSFQNPYLKKLASSYFLEDKDELALDIFRKGVAQTADSSEPSFVAGRGVCLEPWAEPNRMRFSGLNSVSVK